MNNWIKNNLQCLARRLGYQIKRTDGFDIVMEDEFKSIYKKCYGYHLQSVERLYALYQAVKYIAHAQIEGDIAETGVYKGASLMLAAYALKALGSEEKKIYLYDTFEGWPEPGEKDRMFFPKSGTADSKTRWGNTERYSLEEVQSNVYSTKYPKENFIFIKGKVEDTIPKNIPEKISLLRLDTDGYSSTLHGLTHLYPRLVLHGVLIIDDYGHWQGCKKAVDEYFAKHKIKMLLHRIDYTGRVGIKVQTQ